MSKILTKTVKKTTILSVVLAVILAAGLVLGIIFGFNNSVTVKDSKTLTVSLNQYAYLTKVEQVEKDCEAAFGKLDVAYEMKGEMSGDESEIVYVFDKDVNLTAVKAALEATFASKTAEGGAYAGSFITVSVGSEKAVQVLAENYVLRGLIAGGVFVVLAFVYVSIRYKLNLGILAAACTLLGMALTAALIALTRIPVTASVSYVFAVSAMMTAITVLMTLNKIRSNKNEKGEQTTEEAVLQNIAVKEILLFAILGGAAFVIVGAIATTSVRWFALASLVALLVATFIGLIYAPSLYLPMKKWSENKAAGTSKSGYVGAKKASVKAKKNQAKVEVPVQEQAATQAPAEEAEVEAEAVVEETVEETVEEVAEETAEVETEVVEEQATEEAAAEEVEVQAEETTETAEEAAEETETQE